MERGVVWGGRAEVKKQHGEKRRQLKWITKKKKKKKRKKSNKNRYIFIVIINNWVFDFYDYCRCFSKSWFSFHLLLKYGRLSHWKLFNKVVENEKKNLAYDDQRCENRSMSISKICIIYRMLLHACACMHVVANVTT